jgi:hypothetical protein
MLGHVFDELSGYAEGQIDGTRRARVERHLARCGRCRTALAEIRVGIGLASEMRGGAMPDAVAARLRRMLVTRADIDVASTQETVESRERWRVVLPLAAAAVFVLLGTGLYWHVNRPWVRMQAAAGATTAFERDGRALHDALRSGAATPTFTTGDDQAMWDWLASQHAPVTSMRITRSVPEREHFVPRGAMVHTLGGVRTSVLSYRIDGHPVTLALAAAHDVTDAPPPGWWSKRVTHRRDASGVNTLTWTVGGGTYVMVSELDGAGQRACLICHTAPRFREAIQALGR